MEWVRAMYGQPIITIIQVQLIKSGTSGEACTVASEHSYGLVTLPVRDWNADSWVFKIISR